MVIRIKSRGKSQEAIVYANPQAQKDAEAAETAALKADLTNFLQELGRYTIWVLSITMITMVTRSSVTLHFTNQVVKSSIDGALASVPSGNIVTIWHALSLLSEIVFKSEFLFKDKSFASVYRKTYDTFGNIRIGDISLRQVRVKPSTCPTLVTGGVSSSCSPDFSYFDEANSFTKPWDSMWSLPTQRASEFEYKSAQQTQEWFAFSGKNAFYPGSGFVAKFANLNEAAEVLAYLKSHDWIDALTRAVFFDAISYNPNSDVFIQTKILFEIFPSGQFESTIYSRVIDLNFYPSSPSLFDVVNIGLQGIVLILLVYYTKEEATAIFKEGPRAYFSQIWNTFDVANILLLFTLCIMRIILISESSAMLQNLPDASPSKLGSIMILAENECILMGVISVLMWFKMLKYFSMHKPLGKLGRAVSTVIEDILANSVVIICCMFGWAIGQTLVSGMDMQRFSTISISMTAHFCSLFGGYFGDTYPDLSEKSQTGTLLFWTWYLFSQLILLNIFVVIFEYGLVLTMQEDARNRKRTMFSVVKELDVIKKVMTVIQSQEEALAQMESELEIADENDDGLIDEEELKSFLSSNKDATAMFDVQDEKEMMKMFDQDGSGKLDADEMGKLRQFLGKKKRESVENLGKPGSMNLAAKSGHMTAEAMKVLGISAGIMIQEQLDPHMPIDSNSIHYLAEKVETLQGLFSEAQQRLEQILAVRLANFGGSPVRENAFAREIFELQEAEFNDESSDMRTHDATMQTKTRLSPTLLVSATPGSNDSEENPAKMVM